MEQTERKQDENTGSFADMNPQPGQPSPAAVPLNPHMLMPVMLPTNRGQEPSLPSSQQQSQHEENTAFSLLAGLRNVPFNFSLRPNLSEAEMTGQTESMPMQTGVQGGGAAVSDNSRNLFQQLWALVGAPTMVTEGSSLTVKTTTDTISQPEQKMVPHSVPPAIQTVTGQISATVAQCKNAEPPAVQTELDLEMKAVKQKLVYQRRSKTRHVFDIYGRTIRANKNVLTRMEGRCQTWGG